MRDLRLLKVEDESIIESEREKVTTGFQRNVGSVSDFTLKGEAETMCVACTIMSDVNRIPLIIFHAHE